MDTSTFDIVYDKLNIDCVCVCLDNERNLIYEIECEDCHSPGEDVY